MNIFLDVLRISMLLQTLGYHWLLLYFIHFLRHLICLFFNYLLVIIMYYIIFTYVFNYLLLNLTALNILIFVHVTNIVLQLSFRRISFWRWGRLLRVAIVKILGWNLTYHLRILVNDIWRLRGCQLIITLKRLLFYLLLINRSSSRSLAVLSFLFFVYFLNYLTRFYTHWHW